MEIHRVEQRIPSEIEETFHAFETPGVYTVTLTTENIYGCVSTVSEQVNIESNTLNGNIDIDPASTICNGDSVILIAPLADAYLWSQGDTTVGITVFEAGIYEVTVYDAVGCSYSPAPAQIDVIPLPETQITAVEYDEFGQPVGYFYNNYETCFGEDIYLEITENISYSFEWSTTEVGTEISFTEEKENLLIVGTHEFTVTVTDASSGCVNVIGPYTVTVHPVPENIEINSNPLMPVCENTPTIFEVTNPDPNFTYIWNTGEIGTSMTSFYTGEYFVRAINEFGCQGVSNTLEITAGPNIDLIPSGCHSRCNPDTICLPFVPGVAEFQWFHDGNPIPAPDGTIGDFIATESGEYYVEMTNEQGCVTTSDALTLDLFDGFGSILGNVYFDMNDNGIIDGSDTLMSGISIILQNGGTSLDTIDSNNLGVFAFSNILSQGYEVFVDTSSLPPGMIAVIEQVNTELEGCDDEQQVVFLIQYLCENIIENLFFETCEGTTVLYNGDELPAGITVQYTFTNSIGCDSIVEVVVAELLESSNSLTLQACGTNTVEYNGVELIDGSITDFTFVNAVGCDSTVTITIDNLSEDSTIMLFETCSGTTIEYNGTSLDAGSQTDFYYSNSVGCDSVITVIVDELQTYSSDLQFETCTGTTVIYNGEELYPGSLTNYEFTAENGCDSMVSVYVDELLLSSSQIQLEACEGSSVVYNGAELLAGSISEYVFVNVNGCDSIVTVEVNPLEVYSSDLELTACEDDYAVYNGMQIPAGTSQDFVLTAGNGCDSTVTIDVVPISLVSEELTLEACEGTTVDYNGEELLPGSETEFMFVSSVGCDSLVTVFVETLLINSSDLDLSACENETVTYNGQQLQAGSISTFNFTNAAGCDSTVTVTVSSSPLDEISLELFACLDETVEYNNDQLVPGTEADYTFINAQGCDSVVHVSVSAYPDFDYDLLSSKSCWNASEGEINVDYLTGGTPPFEYSMDGVNYQTENEFTDLFPGDYVIFVKDGNSCIKEQIVSVESIAPLSIFIEEPSIPCDGSSVLLEPQVIADDPQAVTYLWPDGSTSPVFEVNTEGVYPLTITNSCETVVREFNIKFQDDKRSSYFFIPNLFSPNGDGVNDEFRIYTTADVEILSFELKIFDRWGNHLKAFQNTDDFWDGSLNDKMMNPGVFVYYYHATILNCGKTKELFRKGDVTLVK